MSNTIVVIVVMYILAVVGHLFIFLLKLYCSLSHSNKEAEYVTNINANTN